jgi:hypothetical protein
MIARDAIATLGRSPAGDARSSRWRIAGIALSMIWLTIPLSDLFSSHPPLWRAALVLAGFAAFLVLYVGLALREQLTPRARAVALTGLVALTATLTLADRSSWALLFVFAAAAWGVRLPTRQAAPAVLGLTALTAGLSALAHASESQLTSLTATTLAGGLSAPTSSSSRRAPRWRAWPSRRSASASRATCTTCSATASR